MAIQQRRGNYANFDKSRMLAGEPAVVLSGDPSATDGKAAYIAFGPNDVKRLVTEEELSDRIRNEIIDQTQDIIDDIHEGIAEDVERAETAAEEAAESAASFTIDDTLTVQGRAADAKKAGDEIADVKHATYAYPYGIQPSQMSLFKSTSNLFCDSFCNHLTAKYYGFNGQHVMTIKSALSWQGWLIRVKPNTTYTLGPLDYNLYLFPSDFTRGVMIKKEEELSDTEPNTITTGDNIFWLSVTQKLTRDMSSWMMVEGDTYPSVYISGYPQWEDLPKLPDNAMSKTTIACGASPINVEYTSSGTTVVIPAGTVFILPTGESAPLANAQTFTITGTQYLSYDSFTGTCFTGTSVSGHETYVFGWVDAANKRGYFNGIDSSTGQSGLVNDLSSAVSASYKAIISGHLLFPVIYERGSITNTGVEQDLQYRVRTKSRYAFDAPTTFTVKDGFEVKLIRWDRETGDLVSSVNWYTESVLLGTVYEYRVVIRRVTEDTSEVADVEEFSSAFYRESTDKTLSDQNMPANAKEVGWKIDKSIRFHPYGIEPFQTSLFIQSANMFSDFCYHITEGYYRYRASTTPEMQIRITPTPNWQGWLIRVKPNTTYTLGPLDYKIELIDDEFNSDVTIENVSSTDPNTIVTGANSVWLCLTQSINHDMSNWMMVEGDTYPSEYISGYPQWVAEPLPSTKSQNKTIAFMGDSITAGVAVASKKAYHMYLHERYGWTCLNYGYGGSGYYKSSTSTTSGRIGMGIPGTGVATNSENAFTPNNIVARLSELDANVIDGIVIFAGTNDWHNNVSVENFISGIESAFEYCKTHYTSIPVLVMTPIHRKNDTVPNNAGKTLREYAEIIIEECKKYSMPYVDTMTMTGMYPDNEANCALFFPDNLTSGLHPGIEGHKRLANAIGETLKEVINCHNFS